MTALIYIAAIIGIIGWVILSIFPGLYLATMSLGGPGGPRSTFAKVSMHIIYSAVIGFISELLLLFSIICFPLIIFNTIKDRRQFRHLGYKITMDEETGDVYAYNPKTGHEVGREFKTRNYDEIITAIEQEYKNSNKTL